MTHKSKIAVVGLGNIGQVVAANLSRSNRPFIAADRKLAKAKELANKPGSTAQASDIPTAVREADIIILAIPFVAVKSFLNQYGTDLEGKIIIDPSNPIAPDSKGGFARIIGENESGGRVNASALPKNAKLVKALGTLGSASLIDAAFQKPSPAALFYATDDTTINGDIEQVIRDMGFEPLHVGDLDQSARIEVFGDLHEYGALGKTVTLPEAKKALAGQLSTADSK